MCTNENVCALSPEIKAIIDECRKYGLLPENVVDNFISRASSEFPLRIGIIGKMKAGKSTLINSLIFNDNILPADVQPLTAVLTQISYNEDCNTSIHVDFFNEEDLQDMENSNDDDVIKQLKKIHSIPDWESRVGKKNHEISIEELTEYTIATGKWSSLVKQVDIKYHHDSLRGISIVDTPGFNDPVKSRVEATNIAVRACQILLFAHNPNTHYDIEEKEMLYKQIAYSQTSKLIDVITRIDNIDINEWESSINRLKSAKENIINELGEDHHISCLLKDAPTIYVCAPMSIIGHKMERGEELSEKEKMLKSDFNKSFELFTASDLIESSNIGVLCKLINVLSDQKSKFIESSYPNELRGELLRAIEECNNQINADKLFEAELSETVDNLIKQIENVERIQDELISVFQSNNLHTQLSLSIENQKDAIIRERDNRINEEFIENNYRRSNIVTNGKEDNHSRYSTFVRHFTCDTRERLGQFKDEFRDKIKGYLRISLNQTLTKLHIEQSEVTIYTTPLYSYCESKTAQINTNVASHTLSERLPGNPQHVKYSNKFESIFTDGYINDLFASFRSAAEFMNFENGGPFKQNVIKVTTSVIEKLRKLIKDPQARINELEECKVRIKNNEDKVNAIENILRQNVTLFKLY